MALLALLATDEGAGGAGTVAATLQHGQPKRWT
jgi:hypothetical protein